MKASGPVVGIVRNYDWPSLERQLPDGKDTWGGVRLLIDEIHEPCDLLVVLNKLNRPIEVECREVWQVVQEPPLPAFPWIFEGQQAYRRIFSPNRTRLPRSDPRRAFSHGALPWRINKTFSELENLDPPAKTERLSWVTSNKGFWPGHRRRLQFLETLLEARIDLRLYGSGFDPIDDKFDGLGAYRYSIAVENYSGPDYWTEKLADCFLSWTMPIYFGCTNVEDYFPEESMVRIDVDDPTAPEKIQRVIESDLYLERRDAIAEARRRVLHEHQLFPFIADRFSGSDRRRERRTIPAYRRGLTSGLRARLNL